MAKDYRSAYDKNEDHDVYYRTRKSIQKIRTSAVAAHLGLAGQIKDLIMAVGVSNARLFAEQCGLTSKEFDLYAKFPDKASDTWGIIASQGVSPEALELLLNSENAILNQGMAVLKLRLPLDLDRLKEIQSSTAEASLTSNELKARFRQQCLLTAGNAEEPKGIAPFENAAKLLYSMMRDYQDGLDLIEKHDRDWLIEADLNPDDPEIELQAKAWGLYKHYLQKLLRTKREQIIEHSKTVLIAFSKLFPDAQVPVADWVSVGAVDQFKRKLAECCFALEALSGGRFETRLPEITSKYHSWSSLSSVAFLAGEAAAFKVPSTSTPRPLIKLNALVINEATGSAALGISASNCTVAVGGCAGNLSLQTIQANRMDWRSNTLALDSPYLVEIASKSSYLAYSRKFDILASSVAFEPSKKGTRLKVKQVCERSLALIEEAKPRGFYIEGVPEFFDVSQTSYLNSLRQAAQQIGYVTVVFNMNAADFGVPQNRPRMILLGIEPQYIERLRLPILRRPISTHVGTAVADLAFPFVSQFSNENRNRAAHARYLRWATRWIYSGGGARSAVPDTLSLIGKRNVRAEWAKSYGFSPNTFGDVQPSTTMSLEALVPLSIPVLKRLQGIPDSWTVVGDDEEQTHQIVCSTPPVVARVLAHTLHQAITGESVDLDLVAREVIAAGHKRGPNEFRIGYAAQADPAKFAEAEWRNYVREEGHIVGYYHNYWENAS